MFTNLENSNNPKFCNGREDKKNKRKRQGEEGEKNSQNPEEQLRKRGRVEMKRSESNRNFKLENEKTHNHNMYRAVITRLQTKQTPNTVVKTRKDKEEIPIESEQSMDKEMGEKIGELWYFWVLGSEKKKKKKLSTKKRYIFEA